MPEVLSKIFPKNINLKRMQEQLLEFLLLMLTHSLYGQNNKKFPRSHQS